jgi:hypothetical protein
MLRILGILVGCVLVVSGLPADPPDQEALESFRVYGDGDCLIVPVTIKGKNYPFIVDTGATGTVYDISLRPLMGARSKSQSVDTADTTLLLETRMPPEGSVGKLPLPREQPAPVCDMTLMRTVVGEDVRGVLGMDFLGRYVVRIDFDASTLTFQKRVHLHTGTALPLHIDKDEGTVYIDAQVFDSGPPVRFLVDTGYSGGEGDIEAGLFDTLGRLGKLDPVEDQLGTTPSHSHRCLFGRLDCLSCGPFALRRALISSGKLSVLGLGFWSRFHVTFDFPGACVYLRKGNGFARPQSINCSGLHIHRPGHATAVAAVDMESAAARAGIKSGDILIAINGLPAERTRLFTLRQHFCQAGKCLSMTLNRGGKELKMLLPLESKPRSPSDKR